MGLLERVFYRTDRDSDDDYERELALETARIRAYRMADDVVVAAKHLTAKALELRKEIETVHATR